MPPKKRGKKRANAPKVLDPLPGLDFLRPAVAYSEDSPAPFFSATTRQIQFSTASFVPPPAGGGDSDPGDADGSLHGTVPAEFIFDYEDRHDVDQLNALTNAEENSDDAQSLSSYTDVDEDAIKDEELGDESGNAESEITGSDTDLEGYDVADLTSFDSSCQSHSCQSEPWSEEPSEDDETKLDELSVIKQVKRDLPVTLENNAVKAREPMTRAKAEWITRKFADLYISKSDAKLPLYTTVEDLLETNINFADMRPETMERLRAIAEEPLRLVPVAQNSGDFERPSSSPPKEVKVKENFTLKSKAGTDGKSSRGTPQTAGKVKSPKIVEKGAPPPPKQIPRLYPAELYDESLRNELLETPWITDEELRVTHDEEDAWVTESCEDISFIEYRRERILRGKKVPIGKKDFELDLIAGRLANKLLAYEAAVDKALPDADCANLDEELFEEQYALPPKPLIPIRVNPNEDPDDEDTTSEEDEPKVSKEGNMKTGRPVDPYHIKPPIHEDDQYHYYNSDRSSSDCESTSAVVRKEIEKKIKRSKTTGTLEIAGQPYSPALPLNVAELASLPVDDLYALAHDLEMPPSELRKELQRPGEEMDYEPDSDDDGWRFVRGTFLYEKTPAYYAIQIKDLEQHIRLKREQWILLELDYNEFSVRNRIELAALEEFILYLGEQKRKEREKVEELTVKLGKLRDEAWKATEYQNWWTAYLMEQKSKMSDRYALEKEHLQAKLFLLREYVEKQREMEATLENLRKQAKNAKICYTAKVSHLLLDSARKKNQLFNDYERRISLVFREYQRALVLSRNDNLQQACSDHVTGRKAAKKFSDRAIKAMAAFKNTTDKLTSMQEKGTIRQELLGLSTRHGDQAEYQLEKLQAVQEYESRKLRQQTETLRCEHEAASNVTKVQHLHEENGGLDKLFSSLKQEQDKLVAHLSAEQSINKQMEGHLSKLVSTIHDYLAYLTAGASTNTNNIKLSHLQSFEDRFIRFLHHAAETFGLAGSKKNRKRPFLAEGDLGFGIYTEA